MIKKLIQINSEELLDRMKDEYYRLHQWDIKTGLPTREVLEQLGLEEFYSKISDSKTPKQEE